MSGARTSTLATLRGRIERLEAHGDAHDLNKVPLGHAAADTVLRGGLAVAAVHEVFAEGHQSATATGFIAGLSARISPRRPLVWIRQDFSELESGALSMSGLRELGLDPRLLVTVRAADTDAALRTAADALACDALGAVVLEVWGQARQLDLVASRKLTLAAQASGVTALLLRMAAEPRPSTAETRWIVRAAHSPLPSLRRLGAPGARRSSTRNWFAIVMARSAAGSWNGNAMSASSPNRRRILSLWLPRLPIDRIKRKLSGSKRTRWVIAPSVVVAKQHNALLIHSLDDLAVRAGLSIGLPLANARAICPELTVFDADEVADRKTLDDIADWCDRFTPLVALDPPYGLYLDITGCAHLFGGERALLQIVSGALARRGFTVSAAIASTSICARTLTRQASRKNHCRWRGGPGRQSAAGLRARRRRCHHRRPAPRRLEDHRRRRLARAPRDHGALRRRLHHLAGAGAGAGRCADQPPQTAAGLHRRKALSRTGRHRKRDRDEFVRARRHAGHGDGQAGQGRAAAGSEFLPHRRRGAHDRGRHRTSGHEGRR